MYVVIGAWEYDGFDEPTGVYSSKEKADAAATHALAEHNYFDVRIKEYALNYGEREKDDQ